MKVVLVLRNAGHHLDDEARNDGASCWPCRHTSMQEQLDLYDALDIVAWKKRDKWTTDAQVRVIVPCRLTRVFPSLPTLYLIYHYNKCNDSVAQKQN